MDISYDPGKNASNIEKHGLSFELARDFDMEDALTDEDTRKRYPEPRFQALGFIDDRLHLRVFASLGDKIRVISLRKANSREVKRYDQAKNH